MRSIVTPLIIQITEEKVSEIIKFQTQEMSNTNIIIFNFKTLFP